MRAAAGAAYWPALTFSDSWAYIDLAYKRLPVGFQDDRPSGYPFLIRILTWPSRDLGIVTTFQHLAGVGVGVLIYLLLLRLGVRRWLAVLATALVVLDGYAVAVEQNIATEAFFTLFLVGSVYLIALRPVSMRAVIASGVLLGIAWTLRSAAIFAVPIWLVYLVWVRRRLLVVAAAVAALALPVLAHSAVRASEGSSFGISRDDGWALYGRVGSIVSCRGISVPSRTRALCDDDPATHPSYPVWYVSNPASPAYRLFPGEGPWYAPKSNKALRDFSFAVIRGRPLAYLHLVTHDFFRYFAPSFSSKEDPILLPAPGGGWPLNAWAEGKRKTYVPGYRPRTGSPATLLHDYGWRVHAQGWLLAAFAVLGLATLFGPPWGRGRAPSRRRQVVFLLVGTALLMLLGGVATVAFVLRYLVPVAPLLIAGGVIALEDVALAVFARSRGSAKAGLKPSEMVAK